MANGIRLDERDTKGRYWLRGEDGSEAEMTFTKSGANTIIIDHTLVPDAGNFPYLLLHDFQNLAHN